MKQNYSEIARKLGVSRQRVFHWYKSGGRVPDKFVLKIEKITGVSRHDLRPDIFGDSVDI